MDKKTLIELVARNIDDLIAKDTVASLTATTIDGNSLIHPLTGQLKGYKLWFYDGGAASQSRVISDFLPANNRVQVDQTFTTSPSTNTAFMIFERFDGDDYELAFQRAYNRFYDFRNNVCNMWDRYISQISRLQDNWHDARTKEQASWYSTQDDAQDNWASLKEEEQAAWVTASEEKQSQWAAAQSDWKNAMDEVWKITHNRIVKDFRNPAFSLPTLNISDVGSIEPGTLPIGTIPIGSMSIGTLMIPSLSLEAAPTIGEVGSISDSVVDEAIVIAGMAEILAGRRISESSEWQNKYVMFQNDVKITKEEEFRVVDELIKSYDSTWTKYVSEYDKSWQGHKERYTAAWNNYQQNHDAIWDAHKTRFDANWEQLRRDYGEYRTLVEQRWNQIVKIYTEMNL
jgi:hypothetical protein